jgi:hypothetical protein
VVIALFLENFISSMGSLTIGSEMPKKKKKGKGIDFTEALLIVAILLLLWLVLKSFKLVDPPDDFITYILEAILGVMITAQFIEAWDFRKKSTDHGEAIIEIKTRLEYIEKSVNEIKTNPKIKDQK